MQAGQPLKRKWSSRSDTQLVRAIRAPGVALGVPLRGFCGAGSMNPMIGPAEHDGSSLGWKRVPMQCVPAARGPVRLFRNGCGWRRKPLLLGEAKES